jgi:hypothetical protein
MKRLLVVGLSVTACLSAAAQCFIGFDNRVSPENIDAPVFRPDGSGAGAGFTAGLFRVPPGGGSLEPLFPTTTFITLSPAGTPYVSPTVVYVPGAKSGDVVTVRMRAWETAAGSYEDALIRGESNDIRLTLHEGFPVSLIGLQGFTMVVVPEPPPGALLALGGGLWLLAARRREVQGLGRPGVGGSTVHRSGLAAGRPRA